MNVPMLLGEWGAFEGDAVPAARLIGRMLEESLSSDTFWVYKKGVENAPYFRMIQRPYPSAVPGTMVRYGLDPETGIFECVWKEQPHATQPSRFYVPALWYSAGCEVELEPTGKGYRFEQVGADEHNGYLSVVPTGQAIERRLTISPRK
jgi:hypothetical protein